MTLAPAEWGQGVALVLIVQGCLEIVGLLLLAVVRAVRARRG